MNALGEAIGELCKVILPIPEERFLGNPGSSVAVCTLSSIDLLKKFQNTKYVLSHNVSCLKIKDDSKSLPVSVVRVILLITEFIKVSISKSVSQSTIPSLSIFCTLIP